MNKKACHRLVELQIGLQLIATRQIWGISMIVQTQCHNIPKGKVFNALGCFCKNIVQRNHQSYRQRSSLSSGATESTSKRSSNSKKRNTLLARNDGFSLKDVENQILGKKKSEDEVLSNGQLLRKMISDCQNRTHLRQHRPSVDWSKKYGDEVSMRLIHDYIKNATVSREKLQKAIAIGDLAIILEQGTKLHLIVDLPPDFSSNTYTFLSEDGDIIYGPRSSIKLRVPGVIPSHIIESLELITLENKYPGIAPSGMPDSTFSRGTYTSSLERKKWKLDTAKKELLSSGAIPDEASLYNVGDGLLVAQAASQFLTDTDVNTYIVPISARKLYDKQLRALSVKSFQLVFYYIQKLEKVFQELEEVSDDSRVFFQTSFSIFELYDLTRQPKVKYNSGPISSEIPIRDYIALLLSLKRSSRTWQVDIQKSTMTPVNVHLNSQLTYFQNEQFKKYLTKQGLSNFEVSYTDFLKGKNVNFNSSHFKEVLKTLKSYVVSGCSNDQVTSSLMSTLVKKIDLRLSKDNTATTTNPLSSEFPQARAHQILTSVMKGTEQNPAHWLKSAKVPNTDTSFEANYFHNYHRYINSNLKDDKMRSIDTSLEFYDTDPLLSIRNSFEDTPVYCIDSETAHEIDDGISIRERGHHFVLTIHVANPTSFIKPLSKLSAISYRMGSTSYLPEGPIMMLPSAISELSGLKPGDGAKRSLAIEFKLKKDGILSYLNEVRLNSDATPSDKLAREVQNQICNSVEIKAYSVNNLPSNFTYEEVNNILNNKDNEALFNSNNLKSKSHELNLFQLYYIARILKHIRIVLGNGLELNNSLTRVSVDKYKAITASGLSTMKNGWSLTLDPNNKQEVTLVTLGQDTNQGHGSKSQDLVSNFMIAANFAGAHYANQHEIPFIYKEQNLNMLESVRVAIDSLTKEAYENKSGSLSFELQLRIVSVLTSASFSTQAGRHESLGIDLYLNLTSPLRRYVDLINHWNLQFFLLKQTGQMNSQGLKLERIASHLQSCENNNRESQRLASRFWICKFLEKYFELKDKGEIDKKIPFSFLLRTDAKFGDVKASITQFPGVNTTIIQNSHLKKQFLEQNFKIGHVVTMEEFLVHSLDFIDGELVIELNEPDTIKD